MGKRGLGYLENELKGILRMMKRGEVKRID